MDFDRLIISENTKTSRNPLYTWNSKWIWPYESPWGIIEKFKLANLALDKDIFEVFGTKSIKDKTRRFYSYAERDLITLFGFDSDKINNVMGLDFKEINRLNIENFIGIIPSSDKIHLYINQILIFCPDCIKLGYHSIFHQIRFIDTCPFHDNVLQDKCPICQRSIRYQLNDKWTKGPFECICGYKYLNNLTFHENINTWRNIPKLNIMSNKLNNWLDISTEQKSKLKDIYFNTNIAIRHYSNLIEYYISLISDSDSVSKNFEHFKFCALKLGIHKEDIHYDIVAFRNRVYKSYITIFRSIARHLRKTILRGHSSCIKSFIKKVFIKSSNNILICPYAYSYVMWRKGIEGYEKFYEVDNKVIPKLRFRNNNGRFINIYNEIVQDIFYEWDKYPTHKNESTEQLFVWSFEKIIGLLFYNRFLNILNISEALLSKGIIDFEINTYDEEIPFFIIKIPGLDTESFEFHYWKNKNYRFDVYDNIKCHLSTKSAKRNDKLDNSLQYYKVNIDL